MEEYSHSHRPCLSRMLCIILSWILIWTAPLAVYASPVTKAEQEKKEAQRKQDEAEQAVKKLEESQEEAVSQAADLGENLTDLLISTDLLVSDMADMEIQIGIADQEYRQVKESQEQQYGAMKRRIQYLYENGNITYLDIVLKAKSIGDLISQREYFSELYDYDKKMIDNYEKIKIEVSERKDQLEEQKSEMEAMKGEYDSQASKLQAMISQKQSEAEDFDQKLAEARKEAEASAAAVREKTEQIRILREQEKSRRPKKPPIKNTVIKSSGGSEYGRRISDYALQFVGGPYEYGGTSLTEGIDCSAYTQTVYRHFGLNIPRNSAQQAHSGREVAYEDMEPGDLVCYSGHVAIYIGDGRIVHASSEKSGIRVSDNPAYRTIVSIRRLI